MLMKLRWYQKEAVEAVKAYWAKGGGHPLVVVPTGGGKSAILGQICKWLVQEHKANVAVITHRKELISQDFDAIKRMWPQAPAGIFSAGLGKKQVAQITVGGVQSNHARQTAAAAARLGMRCALVLPRLVEGRGGPRRRVDVGPGVGGRRGQSRSDHRR